AFDHGDGVAGAGNYEVQVALLHLRVGRHDDELVADAADADGARDLEKRDRRDVQGGAGADHAQDVRIVFAVKRERGPHDLDFAEVVRGEQRADRPVDEPAGENFLGGGSAFALDEAAGELAGRVSLFPVIDDQGEE